MIYSGIYWDRCFLFTLQMKRYWKSCCPWKFLVAPGEKTSIKLSSHGFHMLMALHKIVVTPVLMHWSYRSLVISHRCNLSPISGVLNLGDTCLHVSSWWSPGAGVPGYDPGVTKDWHHRWLMSLRMQISSWSGVKGITEQVLMMVNICANVHIWILNFGHYWNITAKYLNDRDIDCVIYPHFNPSSVWQGLVIVDFFLNHSWQLPCKTFNSLIPRRCRYNLWYALSYHDKYNFLVHVTDRIPENVWRNRSEVHAREPHWWKVDIGSGNGLMPSGNKSLPEPMLTQISIAIWRH